MPLLNYQLSCLRTEEPSLYRCIGSIEAVNDKGFLWVRNEDVTVAVSMNWAQIFLVPPEGSQDGFLQRLQWTRFPLVFEDSKVYILGPYCTNLEGSYFCSTKDEPLIVLLFDGDEQDVIFRVMKAARQPNEYWNSITSYSLALGMLSQLLITMCYSGRPALRFFVLVALTAAFIPILPLLPPGVLFTSIYRRWWRKARQYRSNRDIYELQKQIPPLHHVDYVAESLIGKDIQFYQNRSLLLVLYAVIAVGFGIMVNMIIVFFVLQNLFL
ncbi:hypothetical protein Spica_0546 [Gracilinema caldarium DSM 7334]|uniref:Uncharacterized protein n=2 Tax=Gracilinema caldarium TaxID=215591 RepID=F8F053_GRAC1|nr:hypothetical protein Spica_0546 [Gracilinema caldarium DSM 7334]